MQKLDLLTLGADTLWPLAGYFEESGAYVRAETALLTLVARPETSAEIRPEVAAFYGRLTRMEREALERGGMTPEQARTGFNRFSK
ncbi:MAG: hypothetical protein EHM21_07790 [Chloroflexi bacterium]|nr:MAG: hypothetical protein EHM21_07790 [Chloroflexota bacterium]